MTDLNRSTYPELKPDSNASVRPLTEKMMRDAMDAWLNADYDPCGSERNPHWVSWSAKKRGGHAFCGNCLSVVWLGDPDAS